ncbi:alpha/beta fold hydrolase, partial [Rathayibacter tanaceti]|uniref:alpha/beta fold hydrolase n=1 Tax=Rathayibacter tanaceti TaxID=1671680 RepID=UPI0012903841
MRYRARDGSLLHVDEHGAGRPLVVVPGEPDRHPSYLRCFDTVAGTRRILVLHPRGRGGSEAVPAGSAATTADDLEDLRTHLGVDDLDLVAHDSGCRAALLAAARAPGSVAHLLLIAPGTAWLGIDADHPRAGARRAGATGAARRGRSAPRGARAADLRGRGRRRRGRSAHGPGSPRRPHRAPAARQPRGRRGERSPPVGRR